MGLGYQSTDRHIVDYELWFLKDRQGRIRVPLRGPRHYREGEEYIVFIGAAQTFGRLAPRPFPTLISEQTGRPVLNLGISGAGPSRYFDERLLRLINGASHCVIQVMSGRSVSAGQLEVQSNQGQVKLLSGPKAGEVMLGHRGFRTILKTQGMDAFLAQVRASRKAYVEECRRLFQAITPPKTLLWFAKRDLDEEIPISDGNIGDFPHLVDGPLIRELLDGSGVDFVECSYANRERQINLSPRGELIDKGCEWISEFLDDAEVEALSAQDEIVLVEPRGRTGPPRVTRRSFGYYYPSQAAHDLAAGKLLTSPGFRI